MSPPTPSPLFRLLTPLLSTFRLTTRSNGLLKPFLTSSTTRSFSATSTPQAGRPTKQTNKDTRIALIRYHLQHPKTPRPLKLSRMRALRHWTIHRAWMLFRRKRLQAEHDELYRMYQSMHSACEELRTMDTTEGKDAGRLYRIAMEKKGIFGHGGVPIEYARWQVDTPGREPWNHDWTRT